MKNKEEMLDAIVKEVGLTGIAGDRNIETVYFGGGTPSILSIAELEMILDALKERFAFSADTEISLEANPDDINVEKLLEWRSAGINRLSVGIQSFVEEELKWMNRAHNATDALQCMDMIREAGFANFSVDLIYGSPLLTDADWIKNIDILLQKNVPHISAYALTVEPRTALDKMIAVKRSAPVDPEKQARHFIMLMDRLDNAGYEHYEISNFAKPGMRSRHNSSYWQGKLYHGFGPSAHSFDGNSRRWNIGNNARYVRSLQRGVIPFEEEVLTATQKLNEYIMTSLRTMEGLDLEIVSERSGVEASNALELESGKWQKDGKLLLVGSKLVLTREGKLFADGIAADLFFE